MDCKDLYKQTMDLYDLNKHIHGSQPRGQYHMKHIVYVRKYAALIVDRLGLYIESTKLTCIAYAHDLMKEQGFERSKPADWKGISFPENPCYYVRGNLDVLEKYGLDDYFNTDVQYHPLAAGIFLIKEMGITDPNIIYPVFFHSCPIMEIYHTLPRTTKTLVDTIMLSDKLSSNWLRINMRHTPVRIDLDQAVFGPNGTEFNYTLGLYLAKLIGAGANPGEEAKNAIQYYFNHVKRQYPFMSEPMALKKIGGSKVWPTRKYPAWMTP